MFISLTLCCAGLIFGQLSGSPWPMFHHDLLHTGQSSYAGPHAAAVLWSYETSGLNVSSSPAVGSDGRVYEGGEDNVFYAFASTGALSWSYETEWSVTSSSAIGMDGRVYVGSWDDRFYSFTSDGALSWSYETGSWIYSSCPALCSDGSVYVGSDDNNLYALTSAGSLSWSYAAGHSVRSSPAIGSSGIVYIGSEDNKFYALNSSSTLLWSYTSDDNVTSSPCISSGEELYAGSWDRNLYSLASSGSLSWSYLTGNAILGSPAQGSDGRIYIGSYDTRYYAVSSAGSFMWSYETGSPISYSSAAIGSDGISYVVSWDSKIHAFASNGSVLWSYRNGYGVGFSGISSSPALDSDGALYIGSGASYFYALKNPTPTPTQTPPPPKAEIVLNKTSFYPGDQFTATFVLHDSFRRRFNAYAIVILPDGKILFLPNLTTKVQPIVVDLPGLDAPYEYNLLSLTIPTIISSGEYEIAVLFFDWGKQITSRGDAFLDVSAKFSITQPATPTATPIPHYLDLHVRANGAGGYDFNPGDPLILEWTTSEDLYGYKGKPCMVYLGAALNPLAEDTAAAVNQVVASKALFLFDSHMKAVRYNAKKKANPMYKNVSVPIPGIGSRGTITVTVPNGSAGRWSFVGALLRADNGNFPSEPPVILSNGITLH